MRSNKRTKSVFVCVCACVCVCVHMCVCEVVLREIRKSLK